MRRLRFESDLYLRVWKDGFGFDSDAAQRLLQLCIALGTTGWTSGFGASLVEGIDEVPHHDESALVRFLLDPKSPSSLEMPSAFVTGLRRSLLAGPELEKVRALWSKRVLLDTTDGFLVISGLFHSRGM